MHNVNPEADWSRLDRGLWSAILAMAKPRDETEPFRNWMTFHKNVQYFYHLRHVCKMFDSIFKSNPQFESVLCLRRDLKVQDLATVFAWVNTHGSSVQTLVSSAGNPFIEATLTALHSYQCQNEASALQAFYSMSPGAPAVAQLPDTALLLLQPFSSLVTCALDLNKAQESVPFSLASLEALPCLAKLCLSRGNFAALECAKYLTHLSLLGAQAQCSSDASCVTSLVELCVNYAHLKAFHEDGVCACTRLQELQCLNTSWIEAVDGLQTLSFLDSQAAQIPHGLSRLSRFERLEFFYGRSGSEFNVGWLAHLPSLQHIQVRLDVQSAIFPPRLSALSNLTHLNAVNNIGLLSFALDWSKLQLLQTFIAGSTFQFKAPLNALVTLSRLEEVELRVSNQNRADTTAQINTLAQQIGRRRDIELRVLEEF